MKLLIFSVLVQFLGASAYASGYGCDYVGCVEDNYDNDDYDEQEPYVFPVYSLSCSLLALNDIETSQQEVTTKYVFTTFVFDSMEYNVYMNPEFLESGVVDGFRSYVYVNSVDKTERLGYFKATKFGYCEASTDKNCFNVTFNVSLPKTETEINCKLERTFP